MTEFISELTSMSSWSRLLSVASWRYWFLLFWLKNSMLRELCLEVLELMLKIRDLSGVFARDMASPGGVMVWLISLLTRSVRRPA